MVTLLESVNLPLSYVNFSLPSRLLRLVQQPVESHFAAQTLDAVAYLHRQSPPIVHRDLKCENLLVDTAGGVKLCDLGSATTATYAPDAGWNMARRTAMEEELQKYTTPMYRSPEMVDIWSNYPVGCPGDVWALG